MIWKIKHGDIVDKSPMKRIARKSCLKWWMSFMRNEVEETKNTIITNLKEVFCVFYVVG